jgi:hypothetical protein
MSNQYPTHQAGSTDELRRQGEAAIGETQHDAEQVVRHAGDEAGAVIDTARREVRDVVDEAVSAVSHEADQRTRQVGSSLHDLSHDLHQMARADGDRTNAHEYVDAIANAIDRFADRLETGGTDGAVSALRSTAERRPGSFLTGSALAGFVVGRMIRNGDRPGATASSSTYGETGRATGTPERDGQPSTTGVQREIDLREESPREAEADAYQPQADYTTVGAGRPGTGSIPPPPPPGARPPEAF